MDDFSGVLVVVSHDRFFTDKITKHLFVFEGDGEVKDFSGSLSEYADCLVELESLGSSENNAGAVNIDARKAAQKDGKLQRNERHNAVRKMKKEMTNLESGMEKLKPRVAELQMEIDSSSDEGWSVLAELTEKLDELNSQLDEKELRWLEIAQELELAEAEELV